MKHSNSIQLTLYLIPVLGVIPALWTLYNQKNHSEAVTVSQLSVVLTFSWLIAYSVLGFGETLIPSRIWSIRMLYLNGVLTTGYFLTYLILVIRLWQGKSLKIPGIKRLANQWFRSHSK